MPPGDPAEDERRRERREWIRAHHPDRGGDPVRFAEGLARFDRAVPPHDDPARPTVYRSRAPWRTVRRGLRALSRARDARRHAGRRLL